MVSLADWKSLGEQLLKPAQVRLRSANGDDMGVSGSFLWCVDGAIIKWWSSQLWWRLELPGLCVSATKLVSAGYSIKMRPTQSVLPRSGGGCILLQRCGKRDFLSIRVTKVARTMPSPFPQ